MATYKPHLQVRPERHQAEPVTAVKVDPALWAAALKAGGGDPRRITIIGPHEVRVQALDAVSGAFPRNRGFP